MSKAMFKHRLNYLTLLYCLLRFRLRQLRELSLGQSKRTRWIYRLFCVLIPLKFIYFIGIHMINLKEWQRLAFFDISSISGLGTKNFVVLYEMSMYAISFNYLSHKFIYPYACFYIPYLVLIRNRTRELFLYSTYNNENVHTCLNRFMKLTYINASIYLFYYALHIVQVQLGIWNTYFRLPFQSSLTFRMVTLIGAELGAMVNFSEEVYLFYIGFTMASLLRLSNTVIFIQFHQVKQLLHSMLPQRGRLQSRPLVIRKLALYRRYHTTIVQSVFSMNALLGRIFVDSLFYHSPIGWIITTLFILRLVPTDQVVLFTSVLVVQALTFGVVHLMLTTMSRKIHETSPLLLSLNTKVDLARSPRARLQLTLYIEKFHCRKQYGFTYRSLGLITMLAFARMEQRHQAASHLSKVPMEIKLFLCFIPLRVIYIAVIYFVELNQYQRLLLFDVCHLNGLGIKYLVVLFTLSIDAWVFTYYWYYLFYPTDCFRIPYQWVRHPKISTFFISGRFKGVPVFEYLNRNIRKVFALHYVPLWTFIVNLIRYQNLLYVKFNQLYQNDLEFQQSVLQQFSVIVGAQIGMTTFYIEQVVLVKVGLLVLPAMFLTGTIVRIRFYQIQQLLQSINFAKRQPPARRLIDRKLALFFHFHTATVRSVFSINHLWGRMIFDALLQAPISWLLLTFILLGKIRKQAIFFFGAIIFGQFFAILGIHYVTTKFTRMIHQSSRRLVSLNARVNLEHSPRTRLTLALYISKLHTKKRYGITYLFFGLVSALALAKFVFFYIEYLLLTYNFIQSFQDQL